MSGSLLNNSKRADVSSIVLVLLCLTLFISILTMIYISKNKLEGQISSSVYYMGEGYSEAEAFKNSMHAVMTESFLNAYQKVLKEKAGDFGGEKFSEIESSFRKEVSNNFVNLLNSYYLPRYSSATESEKKRDVIGSYFFIGASSPKYFSYYSYDEILFSFTGWETEYSVNSSGKVAMEVEYATTLNVSVKFRELELPDFQEINFTYSNCKEVSDKKNCLAQEFPNFRVSEVAPLPSAYKLESKDSYYLNKKMDKIVFELSF